MKAILATYSQTGKFNFRNGDILSSASKDVPNLPGVYLVYALKNESKSLVYIGKSGTMCNDGTFKSQLLRKRLNNKQDGIRRQVYFTNKLIIENIDVLEVHWYVTFKDQVQDIPGFVEGLLLQAYYNKNKVLPPWNKGF